MCQKYDRISSGAFSLYWDSNAFALGNFAYGVDTQCCDLLMLKASDYLSIRPEMAAEKQAIETIEKLKAQLVQ